MITSYSGPQSVANHSIARSLAEPLEVGLSRRRVLKDATLAPLLGLPLEFDEPDPAPDFDDDEWDDDEYGPIDVLAESIEAAGIELRPGNPRVWADQISARAALVRCRVPR